MASWIGNKLRKLRLLLWKNMLIEKRRPLVLLFEFILPVIIPSILVLVRSTIAVTIHSNATSFESFPLSLNNLSLLDTSSLLPTGCPNWRLAYAPSGHAKSEMLAQSVVERLPCLLAALMPFADEAEMEDHLSVNSSSMDEVLCGIVFDKTNESLSTQYKIRFPYKLRFAGSDAATWSTDSLFPATSSGPRGPNFGTINISSYLEQYPFIRVLVPDIPDEFNADAFGGLPSYYLEGFLLVQASLDLSILDWLGVSDVDRLEFESRRFPYPPYTDDNFVTVLQSFLGNLFLLCFVFMTFNIVKNLVTEKEKRLKESMKIMGLENYLHWTAWFIQYFIFTLCVVVLTVIFLDAKLSQYKVLPASDWSVVFVFVLLYGTSSMMFCFLLSTLFSKANVAAVIATLLWFLSYLPYLILSSSYDSLSAGIKVFSCLLCNTGMGVGAYLLGEYEASGIGAHWHNIGQPVNSDDNIAFLDVMLMLLLDILLYALLTWYLEAVFPGDFGYPQKCYFFLQKSYWLGSADVEESGTDAEQDCLDKYLEPEPQGLTKGIEISGLRKEFGEKVAVNNLNLSMFNDQITVLLGHNGAGKSTTMSMLTGLFPPTSGNAVVNGFKLKGQLGQVRESLGLCPQHDVLFDQLTVHEHLVFFGSLKGASKAELDTEIPNLLAMLQLEPKRHARSKTLSGGMKRKLSVAIALIGKSKIVILDEPTSGMDPAARRLTWDVLLANKTDRSIMLTTHFMDEADVLGDRIAIMADGRLQCCGSSLFLKKKYGVGYQLTVVKNETCRVDNMEQLIQSFVPGAFIERNVGSELMITLPAKFVDKFYPLFQEMESNQEKLGIESYGVSVTTIEEVFLRVGKLYDDEETLKAEGRHMSISSAGAGAGPHGEEDKDEVALSTQSTSINFAYNDVSAKYTSTVELWWHQFYATFVKRMIHSMRNKKMAIAQILIPAFCVSAALLVTKLVSSDLDSPQLVMNLDDYKETIVEVSADSSDRFFRRMAESYESVVKEAAYKGSSVANVSSVEAYIIESADKDLGLYNMKLMVAAEFSEEKVVVWFNNQAFHTAPMSLNLISNAIIKAAGFQHHIEASNYPLPPNIDDTQQAVEDGAAIWQGFNIAFMLSFGFAFLVATFVIFPVKERTTKSKHLQYVSGLHPTLFWMSAFAWDIVNFLVSCLILIVLFAMFQVDAYSEARLFYVALVFCEYSLAALPMMYCCSFLFQDSTSAFVWCATINIILAVGTMMTVVILEALGKDTVSDNLGWAFLVLVPQYALPMALVDLYTNYESNYFCRENGYITYDECSSIFGNQVSDGYFTWQRPGVSRYCVFFLLQSVAFWIALVCIESNITQVFRSKIAGLRAKVSPSQNSYDLLTNEDNARMNNGGVENGHAVCGVEVDADVEKEATYVKNSLAEAKESSTLVVDALTKTYYMGQGLFCGDVNAVKAVKEMYLTVSPAECYGLLGINGAGKTTTFKMLTGDIPMSSGTAYINGLDISRNIQKAQQLMGYCPQFDALIDQMTGRETLRMFARLRGLKSEHIENCIEELIVLLDLSKHADKMTKAYSGGNKRKLSTAIAMIGLPPLVFLDEPTTGMDPGARRFLWKVILHLVRSCSLSVILTSHSMEECEYLCSRLSIMVNGQFKCIGSPQHLKSRFGQGFTLVAKLQYDPTFENKKQYHQFINNTFPDSVLKDEHLTMIQYQVRSPDVKWSQVFRTMESNKQHLNLVDYSVSQTSLEQVFLNFARDQAQ